ncbi:MAG: nitroreductase [Succinivibrio sp.]|nr:nitroreductase [Succinivibrio sp.]
MHPVLECLVTRRACRKFKSTVVTDDLLQQVIDAGLYAPSGHGSQSATIIAIKNPKLKAEISAENCKYGPWEPPFDPFYGAPVILLVVAKKDCPTAVYDGTLVLGNLQNAAHALGLASCWIHRAREEMESDWGKDLLKSLGLEGEYLGVGHLALGYREGESNEAAPRLDGRSIIIH